MSRLSLVLVGASAALLASPVAAFGGGGGAIPAPEIGAGVVGLAAAAFLYRRLRKRSAR